jgi:hypothetical protein
VIICVVILAFAAALVTARAVGQRAHVTALPRASCGRAWTQFHLGSRTQLYRAEPGTLACFGTAARECKPASIDITYFLMDFGVEYVFTIEPGGTPCQVNELSQGFGGALTHGPVIAMGCQRTAISGRGTELRCGGQDVLIPAQLSPLPKLPQAYRTVTRSCQHGHSRQDDRSAVLRMSDSSAPARWLKRSGRSRIGYTSSAFSIASADPASALRAGCDNHRGAVRRSRGCGHVVTAPAMMPG